MPFPRLTWAGLLIATLGWGFLLPTRFSLPLFPMQAPRRSDDPVRFIPRSRRECRRHRPRHRGARRAGATLAPARQASPAMAPRSRSPDPASPSDRPSAAPAHRPSAPMQTPLLMPQRSPSDVVTRGALNGRDYVLFRDGSVVVETLLGARRFPLDHRSPGIHRRNLSQFRQYVVAGAIPTRWRRPAPSPGTH